MDRLLVSAPHKSSGKTTLTLGLCAAFAAAGVRVQPFKKGPDYIDPMWLARAAGRRCLNLDPYLMDDASLTRCFAQGLCGAELAVVEGNKGTTAWRWTAATATPRWRAGSACRCCWWSTAAA
jgi:cobyrinic acid a,c-diamide synthase